jgi:hypothetical protein
MQLKYLKNKLKEHFHCVTLIWNKYTPDVACNSKKKVFEEEI